MIYLYQYLDQYKDVALFWLEREKDAPSSSSVGKGIQKETSKRNLSMVRCSRSYICIPLSFPLRTVSAASYILACCAFVFTNVKVWVNISGDFFFDPLVILGVC